MNQLANINRILIFILLVVVILYWGEVFIIPLIFAFLFASLMVPLCNFLERIKINRAIASLLSTLALFIVFGVIMFLFITQANLFAADMPTMKEKMDDLIESSQNRIESITNISLGEQDKIFEENSGQMIEKIEPFVTRFFGSVFSTVFSFFLIMFYVFFLLLYRQKIFDFVMMYVSDNKEAPAKDTLNKIGKVAFQYLWGRIKVMLILGVLFFITFILFGLPYALLFTLFGAVITIIPYFGPLLSGVLPILYSLLYFDSMTKIIFFASVIIAIQLVESYVLEPLILGKEVNLNPLIIIITIIAGGIMWGLAGMILFVPMVAMIKIISLNHPGLKPVGFLLGQDKKEEFENSKNNPA